MLCSSSLGSAQFTPATPQIVIPPTKTAIATPTDFPDASGGFEATGINTHQYAPSWPPWAFQSLIYGQPPGGPDFARGSGIAHDNSSLLVESAQAPEGDRVAFLHGVGKATCSFTFQPGIWRLRFLAAQRVQNGLPNQQVVRVSIGGTNVFEQELDGGTYKEYLTELVHVSSASTMTVEFKGLTASTDDIGLIDRVLLDRVLPWNSTTTWGGAVPTGADDVFIPQFTAVAMDGACFAATVQNEGLLLADEMDGSLKARWVLVHEDGRFRVGTEQQPFAYDFEVVLKGNSINENVMHAGSKFLAAVHKGEIDMHGLSKKSWTKLASIDNTGATSVITVDDATGWQVGDEIVVAWTGWIDHEETGDSLPRSRRCTITAINGTSGALTLDSALLAAHHCTAASQPYQSGANSWTLEQRAEVGMLSRNVRVVSDLAPGSAFGGHVMIMGHADGHHGRGRFSNVELRELGQEARIGRYPMHWHMQHDNGAGQYMRNCSVNKGLNRAITIHGSNYVTVEDNAIFDVQGHSIFLEDGVEEHNQVHRNLVVFTKRPLPSQAVLKSDHQLDQVQNRTPAAFWITHPNNHFIGNVVAETVGTAYWFALHSHPTGTSAKPEWAFLFGGIDATQAPLGTFDDNVAHGCKSAFDVNDSLLDLNQTPEDPTDDDIWPNRSWDPPTPEVINGLVAYGCTIGIYAGLGTENTYTDRVTFNECVFADNGASIQLGCAFIVKDSLIVHDSGNGIFVNPSGHPFQQGHAMNVYDGPASTVTSHFVGFDGPGGASVFFDGFGAARRHTNHLVEGLTFEGTGAPMMLFSSYLSGTPESQVWGVAVQDLDGSLSRGQFPGYTLITNHPMMRVHNGGGVTPDKRAAGTFAWFSPFKFGHLQVHHYRQYYPGYQFLTGTLMPSTGFGRKAHSIWTAASYDSVTDSNDPQIRQIPAIVQRPDESTTFEYTVQLRQDADPGAPIPNRVDIVMDDLDIGDVTRLELTHQVQGTSWAPFVYLNDLGSNIPCGEPGSGIPCDWTLLSPGGSNPSLTSYTISNGTVSLRMVNTQRAHRVTFAW